MRPQADTIRPYVIHVNKNIPFLKHAPSFFTDLNFHALWLINVFYFDKTVAPWVCAAKHFFCI